MAREHFIDLCGFLGVSRNLLTLHPVGRLLLLGAQRARRRRRLAREWLRHP